ncbi:MAG: GrpB family protein [Thermoanaerobacteraceae bacterium]|nr:GrpB family protein [Thermoanaerobacteraceae bacterium]
MRTDNELKGQYQELKVKLAEKYRNDRVAYTESKTKFINSILMGIKEE